MSIRKFTVSRDDSIYEAFPDLVLTASGKLVCVFAECTHHGDRSFTRIVTRHSNDRGRTWGEKRPVTEATKDFPYYNCPRISKLDDGRLVMACDMGYNPANTGGRNFLWFSPDEGMSWEGPVEAPLSGIVPDKLLELSTGRWLLAAHEKDAESGFIIQRLIFSDDSGKNWSGPVMVAKQEGLHLCEASILELPDHTLVAYMRENSGEGFDCYKSISKDAGESWSGPYRVPLPGCHRPVAGLLNSGRIMLTYRFMQGGKGWLGTWTQNFFAALFDVESARAVERNEQWSRIMPVDFDRSRESDLGYSGWVQFEDGEIYIVAYIMDDAPKAQIRGYSLREEDFML